MVSNKAGFHNKILKTIEECSYNFYIVKPDKTIKCTCVNHTTRQAAPDCVKCLGTGYKIVIKMYRGACNDDMTGSASRGKMSQIIKYYFVPAKYIVNEDDIIIDDNEAFYVFRSERQKALHGHLTHQEVTAVKRKNDHDILMVNFWNIINKAKQK